jgi:hypothetical protein
MSRVGLLLATLFVACSAQDAPLVDMRAVPEVVSMSPAEARRTLEDAGFKVEFTRPKIYCIPEDPLCNGPLDGKALQTLDVATQSGTQGKKRPEGSTITLILGSAVHETIVE